MAQAALDVIEHSNFTYQGIDVPALRISRDVLTNLGTREQAHVLAPQSAPYVWKTGLYLAGRDQPESLGDSELEASKLVYDHSQARDGNGHRISRGAWHKDGLLYLRRDETPKGWKPPAEGEILALYFRDIEGFEKGSDGWEIKPSDDTEEFLIRLPRGGGWYAVPTCDGLVHPETGTYLHTVESEQEALRHWIDAGFTEDQAKQELSRFHRGSETERPYTVFSWSSVDYGSLLLYLNLVPWYRYDDIGSFDASRLASGASPDSGKTVPKAEYNQLKRKAAAFDELHDAFERANV